ncbi:MAG: CAP domain-containing protein [Planctomycetes bacterium]|nr:CAP domain-containing protein [Planctomycetota bacterium]
MYRITACIAVILASCWADTSLAQRQKPETGEAAATPAVVDWLMQSAYGPGRVAENGASGKCGAISFKFTTDKATGGLVLTAGSTRLPVPAEGATLELPGRGRASRIAVYPDDVGVLHWFAGDAVAVTLDGLDLLFIDGNMNGKFAEPVHDFIAAGPRGGFAFPVAKEVPLLDFAYSFQDAGDALKYSRLPFTTTGKARELQNALNRVRMDFGLFPAASKAEWDAAAQAHCEYMHKHGKMSHSQDPKADGYSKQGDEAARTSNLTAKNTPEGAIKLWLGQPLHGRQIRTTWLTVSGFGFHEGYACLRIKDTSPPEMSVERMVVFPPNGARDVPITWAPNEAPEPRLAADTEPGYPLTFSFGWNQDVAPRDLKARLERKEGDGWVPVAAQVSWNENNAPDALARMKYAFVLPVERLQPGSIYRLSGEAVLERDTTKFSSSFRTGTSTNARSWDTAQQR